MTMTPQPPPSPPQPPGETDPRFPSGPWQGFFLMAHLPGRHRMELHLSFRQGVMTGEGRDMIGPFLIRGKYNLDDGKCRWTKRYIGKHDVAYQGYNEGKGIWGVWEIPPTSRGGFHIWPSAMGDPTSPSSPKRSMSRRKSSPSRRLKRSALPSPSRLEHRRIRRRQDGHSVLVGRFATVGQKLTHFPIRAQERR